MASGRPRRGHFRCASRRAAGRLLLPDRPVDGCALVSWRLPHGGWVRFLGRARLPGARLVARTALGLTAAGAVWAVGLQSSFAAGATPARPATSAANGDESRAPVLRYLGPAPARAPDLGPAPARAPDQGPDVGPAGSPDHGPPRLWAPVTPARPAGAPLPRSPTRRPSAGAAPPGRPPPPAGMRLRRQRGGVPDRDRPSGGQRPGGGRADHQHRDHQRPGVQRPHHHQRPGVQRPHHQRPGVQRSHHQRRPGVQRPHHQRPRPGPPCRTPAGRQRRVPGNIESGRGSSARRQPMDDRRHGPGCRLGTAPVRPRTGRLLVAGR